MARRMVRKHKGKGHFTPDFSVSCVDLLNSLANDFFPFLCRFYFNVYLRIPMTFVLLLARTLVDWSSEVLYTHVTVQGAEVSCGWGHVPPQLQPKPQPGELPLDHIVVEMGDLMTDLVLFCKSVWLWVVPSKILTPVLTKWATDFDEWFRGKHVCFASQCRATILKWVPCESLVLYWSESLVLTGRCGADRDTWPGTAPSHQEHTATCPQHLQLSNTSKTLYLHLLLLLLLLLLRYHHQYRHHYHHCYHIKKPGEICSECLAGKHGWDEEVAGRTVHQHQHLLQGKQGLSQEEDGKCGWSVCGSITPSCCREGGVGGAWQGPGILVITCSWESPDIAIIAVCWESPSIVVIAIAMACRCQWWQGKQTGELRVCVLLCVCQFLCWCVRVCVYKILRDVCHGYMTKYTDVCVRVWEWFWEMCMVVEWPGMWICSCCVSHTLCVCV